MAQLSDQLLMATILGYTLAMLCYAAEYSFGSRGAVARVAVARQREPELVAVGGGAPTPPAPPVVVAERGGTPGRAAWFGRIAVGLTVLAVLAHVGVLVTRGLAAHRVPWGNMYEFVVAV